MKGVFCLEGFWYGDHRDSTSVYPVLDLVHRYQKMPFIHHRCGTKEEFEYSIKRWKQKSFHNKYPLLYLGFHGEPGSILIGKTKITLDQLAELLENYCSGVIIYFGSCATLNVDRRILQRFMEKTETVALLGYKVDVEWLKSAAFEIRLLDFLLSHPFDSKGVERIKADLERECRTSIKELDFRFIPNDRVWFPRKRK